MNFRGLLVFFLAATGFLWSGTPRAHAAAVELGPAIVISEGKSPQGYPYIHGGVGSDERAAMEERGKSYNVKFSFADKRGPYIAGVKVLLEGENRTEIVNVVSNGPWFYIQLPPGTYNLKATFGPKTSEVKAFKVSKDKKINQTLIWDLGEDTGPLALR
jgi:hypothetical protein